MPPVARFRISWVLQHQLALGPAPWAERHLQLLRDNGIQSVLSLSSVEECPPPPQMEQWFECRRLVLPDHRTGRTPTTQQLQQALELLETLSTNGPVFVHCIAAMERSPLLCLAWLMRQCGLTRLQALDYLCELHPGTNPLPQQLALLTPELLQTPAESCQKTQSDL